MKYKTCIRDVKKQMACVCKECGHGNLDEWKKCMKYGTKNHKKD